MYMLREAISATPEVVEEQPKSKLVQLGVGLAQGIEKGLEKGLEKAAEAEKAAKAALVRRTSHGQIDPLSLSPTRNRSPSSGKGRSPGFGRSGCSSDTVSNAVDPRRAVAGTSFRAHDEPNPVLDAVAQFDEKGPSRFPRLPRVTVRRKEPVLITAKKAPQGATTLGLQVVVPRPASDSVDSVEMDQWSRV